MAAGMGSRFGGTTPKQLHTVGGRRVLDHAIAALHEVDEVDEVVVIAPNGRAAELDATIDRTQFPKVSRTVDGGQDRHESTWRAIEALGDDECDVLVHDAVRPLVDGAVVRACIAALDESTAVAPVVPVEDTVATVDGDVVTGFLDRDSLRLVQTPQAFRLSVLRAAYELARAQTDQPDATDNCGVVHRYLPDVTIRVIPGSPANIKITRPEDLAVVDALLRDDT